MDTAQAARLASAPYPNLTRQRPLTAVLSIGVLAVVLGVMAAAYTATLTPVTIVVDGQSRVVRTNQRTVEDVLREAGVALAPEDLVQPDPASALPGQPVTIAVQRAQPVTIVADGQTQHIRTQATDVADMLRQAGVTLGPHDRVVVDNQMMAAATDASGLSPLVLSVQRAIPIAIEIGDAEARAIETVARTVGQALDAAGIEVYLADRIQPALSTRLTPGLRVRIEPSIPVQVEVDGRVVRSRTLQRTVAGALADLDVLLVDQDYTQPALDAPIDPGAIIRVVRVREELIIEQEPIPFDTQQVLDPNVELDTVTVEPGENGLRQRRVRIRFENDREVARTIEDESVLRPPSDKIIRYGTQVVVRTLQTPDGPIEYWRHVRMYATSYSAATAGTPRTSPWYGITASGLRMRKGLVAVDPSVVRLGWNVYVPGYGKGLAADTGGGVRGRWIDLGYDDDNLVSWHQWVDVYLLTPVPPADRIPYSLPDWPTFPGR